ncbi:hypothetical protein [Mucilaginibacter sp. SG564]|uniref:hypothetical protein n=1 Tax=Mucilaginibacter sp. SG564 TaxID=2587022 RepID=UPI0015556F9B|nr:hypothetical protein [Mucilaginibacter sp. SG564]NOW96084.1 hypothetical protein [Mucilaginibacter sp. SG564]
MQIFILAAMANPVIGFGIVYGDEMIYCEASMTERSYEIFFNGLWMASVEHTDQFNWIQASGVILPQSIIDEIGQRIESHYN